MTTTPDHPRHTTDADCSVDPATDVCTECGVHHGEPCRECGSAAFHEPDCGFGDGSADYPDALSQKRHTRPASFGTEPSPPRFRTEIHRESPHDDRVTSIDLLVGSGSEPLRIRIGSLVSLDELLDALESAEVEWSGESDCAGRAEDRASGRAA